MRKRSLMAILACGFLLSLAGCGAGGATGSRVTPVAKTLYSDALAALRSAQSVRMSGTASDGGRVEGIDLGYFRSGAVGGTLTGPFGRASSVSFHVIVTGGAAYILVDRKFFRKALEGGAVHASACAVLCGKYVKVPATEFGVILNRDSLISHMIKSSVKLSATVTSSTIDGQQAYRLTDSQGDHLYVAKNGIHYPIEVTGSGSSGSGTLTFSEWNNVPPISAPPASQIIISVPTGTG